MTLVRTVPERALTGGNLIGFSALTVQGLQLLSSVDGVQIGSLALVLATGNTYRCVSAGVGSTWEPASGLWDIRDFGASPTRPDNEVPNQAAMDACVAVAGTGKVYAPAGIYPVTGTTVVRPGVSFVGDSPSATRFVGALAAPLFSDGGVSVSDCFLGYFAVDNANPATAGGVGLSLTGGSQRNEINLVRAFNVEVGFQLTGATYYNTFKLCTADNVARGFSDTAGAHENEFLSCGVRTPSDKAYEINGVSNSAFLGCWVQNLQAGAFGYHLDNGAVQTLIDHPRIEAPAPAGTGIHIDDATVQWTEIRAPYYQNVVTAIVDNGTKTFHRYRKQQYGVWISETPTGGAFTQVLFDAADPIAAQPMIDFRDAADTDWVNGTFKRIGAGANPFNADVNRDDGSFGSLSGVNGGVTVWGTAEAGLMAGESDGAGGVTDADAGDFFFDFASDSWRMRIRNVLYFLWRNNGGTIFFAPTTTTVGHLGQPALRFQRVYAQGAAYQVEPDAAVITLGDKSLVVVDSSVALRTINLPTLSSANQQGFWYEINFKAGGNAANLTPNAGDKINGGVAGVAKDLNVTGAGLYKVWSDANGVDWYAFGPIAAI